MISAGSGHHKFPSGIRGIFPYKYEYKNTALSGAVFLTYWNAGLEIIRLTGYNIMQIS